MAWLRLYDDLPENAKMQRLPLVLFRACVNLWAIAKRNGGKLPSLETVAFGLRVPATKAQQWIDALERAACLDRNDDGTLSPHDWHKHQYESDNVTERTRKHRAKQRGNVPITVPITVPGNADKTLPEQPPEAETEQIQSRTEGGGAAIAASPATEDELLTIPPFLDRRKGTRLPDDWGLSAEWRVAALDQREKFNLPAVDLDLEAEKFRNHWHGASGQRGVKRDWRATWINWVLRVDERKGNGKESHHAATLRAWSTAAQQPRGDSADPGAAGVAFSGDDPDGTRERIAEY